MRRFFWFLFAACGLGVGCVPPVAAQASIDVGPFLALYAPQGDFEPAAYYTTRLPGSPQDLRGAAWGMQVRTWLTQHFGVQGHFAMSSSTVGGVFSPAGPTPHRTARVLTTSVMAVARRDSAVRGMQIYVGAGPGVIHHGGEAYEPYRSPVQLASVLGPGSQFQ